MSSCHMKEKTYFIESGLQTKANLKLHMANYARELQAEKTT